MINKKSQAALEFLSTYGWAILVLLVVLVALGYFGVLDPGKLMGSRCIFSSEFSCLSHNMHNNGVEFIIKNNVGELIKVTALNITTSKGQVECSSLTIDGESELEPWASGDTKKVSVICNFEGAYLVPGEKEKLFVALSYYKVMSGSGYEHKVHGELIDLVGDTGLETGESLNPPCKNYIIDPNFQSCIAGTLAKNWADVTDADMLAFAGILDCAGASILNIDGIQCLSNLNELYLYNNQLTSLPTEIGSLGSLTKIYFGNNLLTSIPSQIGNLTSLLSLSFYSNQLTSIPSQIGNLTNLYGLYLNDNKITSLPPEIGNLGSLTKIYIQDNQLTFIPAEIGNLSGLTTLLAWNNQLTSLPDSMGNIQNLGRLDVASNNILSLPDSIGNADWLWRLDLENNAELSSIPVYNGVYGGSYLGELYIMNTNMDCSHPNIASWGSPYCVD